MKTKYALLYSLLCIAFASCIDEYKIKGIDELSNLLVVDGTITDYTTQIKITRSIGLEADISDITPVRDAKVEIEVENGQSFLASSALSEKEKGLYIIENGLLEENKSYRLKLEVDGLTYYSSFLSPLNTPPIDSIFLRKEARGLPVKVCVSTSDKQTDHRFYRWTYNDTWEMQAKYFAEIYINEYGDTIRTNPKDNRYYCWQSSRSYDFILESSIRNKENKIENKSILEFKPSHSRLSTLYYINVKQNLIRKEGFDYFTNLQKNIEQTGSIFAPVPSEMKGNLYCETDDEIPIIGYVEVSKTTTLENFFDFSYIHDFYEPPFDYCQVKFAYEPGLWIFEYDPPQVTYAEPKCLDCTLVGGTKNRPEFWPNDHY